LQVVVDGRYFCTLHRSLANFTGNLLRALVALEVGQRPVVLIPSDLHPVSEPIREDLGDHVRWIGPERPVEPIVQLWPELRWVHREMPRLLRHHVPETDLLVIPYHHPPFRTPGVRRAVVLHDLCGLGEGFPKTKKNYWRHYLRLRAAAHMADVIWPISEATRDDMTSRFPASRTRMGPVVYNGVDRTRVSENDLVGVLANHGLQKLRYVVAYATWQERKNFSATLAALKLLRDRGRPIRLVGIAPEGEADGIRGWCEAEGLADSVIVSGVTDAHLDALYAGALTLVWPSRCEGFGYPVVEAMVQGCPPLVSCVGPGAELVQGAIETLPILDASTIADRIVGLMDFDPEDRRELATSLRQRAAAFSLDAYQRQLGAALTQLDSAN